MIFDKLKELSKDTGIYGISTMVGRFLTFLLVPFYTHIFSEATFGIYTNFYSFIMIFNIFFIYGMDAAYLKFAGIQKSGDEKDNFSTPYLSVFVVGIVLSLLIIAFRKLVYSGFDLPFDSLNLIYYVVPIMFIDAIAVIPFLQLRLERKAKTFAAFKLINIFVNVALNLFLILKLKWGIEAVFVSNLAASLVSFILTFPVVLKKLKFRMNFVLLKRLLKFGIPYLPAALASMMVQGIDKPILSHLTDLSTTGIYGANYKLGIFMMLFVNMFQYAWQPFFLQNAQEKNAKALFSKVMTYFTIAASLILVLISLFIGDIVRINFFGHTIIQKDFWVGLDIVPVILFGYMFNGLYVIFTAGIFIEEKSIYVPFITGLGALINIGVNFMLIPPMGMMGAALATLAAYFAMAISLYIVTQKFYKIEYELFKLTKIFSAILIS
ncbi:MAG TPA: oligosaccharide flippase family protein, partial [Ignavibacteriaceae bacterium]|nr:oligosaccharide flippase family protein [Ignavibacteriaceae bacterium]